MKPSDELAPLAADTREPPHTRYGFDSTRFTLTVKKLDAGDYSLVGFENEVAIERKTLGDFIRSITIERPRFFRELELLKTYRFAAVVVEADLADLAVGNYRSAASPESVLGTVFAICTRFVPVFFCGDRVEARRMTEGLLRRFWLDERARCAAPESSTSCHTGCAP